MFFLWIIIAGLLQMTVLNGLNLLLASAIFSGLRNGPTIGALVGGAIGLYAGVLSMASFGFIILIYCSLGLLAGIVKRYIIVLRSR